MNKLNMRRTLAGSPTLRMKDGGGLGTLDRHANDMQQAYERANSEVGAINHGTSDAPTFFQTAGNRAQRGVVGLGNKIGLGMTMPQDIQQRFMQQNLINHPGQTVRAAAPAPVQQAAPQVDFQGGGTGTGPNQTMATRLRTGMSTPASYTGAVGGGRGLGPAADPRILGLRDGGPTPDYSSQVMHHTGMGGPVPGKGKGDKTKALLEEGEIVVSNGMKEEAPQLEPFLLSLREKVLADKGMTPEEADAKAMGGKTLRAVDGFDYDPKTKTLTPQAPAPSPGREVVARPNFTMGNNELPTASSSRAMVPAGGPAMQVNGPSTALATTTDMGRNGSRPNFTMGNNAMPSTPAFQGPAMNPNVGAAGSAEAQAFRAGRLPTTPTLSEPTPSQGSLRGTLKAGANSLTGAALGGAFAYSIGKATPSPDATPEQVRAADEWRVKSGASQIPAEGSEPTPGGTPYNVWDTNTGRNITNTINALGPMSGAIGSISNTLRAGSNAARVMNGVNAGLTAASGVPAGAAMSQEAASPTPASNPLNPAKMLERQSGSAGVAEPTEPTLLGQEGRQVGNTGAYRFDIPGKSPVYTDKASLRDTEQMLSRPAMSADDPGMQGIQARQDGRMNSLRQQAQYDQEVAAADKINEAGRRMNLEYGARRGNIQDARTLRDMNRADAAEKTNAVTLRGQDMKLQGEMYQTDGAARTASAKGRYESLRDERTYRDGRADKKFEQDTKAVEQGRESLKMFKKDDKGNSVRDLESENATFELAQRQNPDWATLPPDRRSQLLTEARDVTSLIGNLDKNQNNTWWQKYGLGNNNAKMSTLPKLKGATHETLGVGEGLATAGASTGDYKLTIDGKPLYLTRDDVSEDQLAYLEKQGVKIKKD